MNQTPPSGTRTLWLDQLNQLASLPLRTLAERRGMQDMPVTGIAGCVTGLSKPVAFLECVGRLGCGIAPWLDSQEPEEQAQRARITRELAAAIESILDPDSPDHCPMDRAHQTLVDMAFVAQAFLRSPQALTGAISEKGRQQIAESMREVCRIHTPWQNNWLLFSACCQALLRAWGEPHDPSLIAYAIKMHAQWYLGDSTYGDGPAYHWDYYNSYVIQPMMLDILRVDAKTDPAPSWFEDINLITAEARLSRWAEVQERMIARDGTYPALGRSLCYRSGAFQGLAAAAFYQLLPETLKPSQVRCALSAVHEVTLGHPGTYDPEGWLTIGVAGHQPGLGESYITTGSVYLTSTSFLPLGLPASHPFWTDADAPWTAQRLWGGEDLPLDHARG